MTPSDPVLLMGVIGAAVLGAGAGSLAGCMPALHIYALMGGLLGFLGHDAFTAVPGLWLSALAIGLVTGWTLTNAAPAILLSAPDESALFTVLPGQRYMMSQRGGEAVLLTALGAAGAVAIVAAFAPLAPHLLPRLHRVMAPHYHWMVWTVIVFMLMSEWPKGRTAARTPWDRFVSGTANTWAGLATFGLSGLLGFIMFYRSPLPPHSAFLNLTPVFAGLFAAPGLLVNLISRVRIPTQHPCACARLGLREFIGGVGSGTLGGAFAAWVPVVSGGVGGMLAGHATSLRDERSFLVAQGASRATYYLGGLMLLFVPGLAVTRGAGASMLQGLYGPVASDYWPAVAALLIATATALALVPLCTRLTLHALNRIGYRTLSWCALAIIVLLVFGLTHWTGLAIMAVATGIGLIPVLFDSRRMNALGVILLPMACNLSGIGPDIARSLGLL